MNPKDGTTPRIGSFGMPHSAINDSGHYEVWTRGCCCSHISLLWQYLCFFQWGVMREGMEYCAVHFLILT